MALTYEVLVERAETRNKCTILPLSHRPDFVIKRFSRRRPLPLMGAELLLHMNGEPLDALLREGALAGVKTLGALDCHWSRCGSILSSARTPLPRLARIPAGFVTAYPRKSWSGNDPEGGLASIEAIFIAAAFLGRWDTSLLEEYYFGAAFLEANREAFARYGCEP